MKRIILATACAAFFSAPALADHGHNHGEKAEKYDGTMTPWKQARQCLQTVKWSPVLQSIS